MKNTILILLATLFFVSCGRPKDAVFVKLQPTDSDTFIYQYQSNQTSNMGENKHGATIERRLGIRFKSIMTKNKSDEINIQLILDGVSMYQKMPGSGVNSFNTDYQDSIEGGSSKMLLNNFMKFVGSNTFNLFDSLGKIKDQNQQAVYDKIGSSEMSDFLINHPIVLGLDDGYFWKGKSWQNESLFKEAGINFLVSTTNNVSNIDDNFVYISSISKVEPSNEDRNFELTATADIKNNYSINRKTGLIEKCSWTELFDIIAVKDGVNVPINTKRISTLSIVK